MLGVGAVDGGAEDVEGFEDFPEVHATPNRAAKAETSP